MTTEKSVTTSVRLPEKTKKRLNLLAMLQDVPTAIALQKIIDEKYSRQYRVIDLWTRLSGLDHEEWSIPEPVIIDPEIDLEAREVALQKELDRISRAEHATMTSKASVGGATDVLHALRRKELIIVRGKLIHPHTVRPTKTFPFTDIANATWIYNLDRCNKRDRLRIPVPIKDVYDEIEDRKVGIFSFQDESTKEIIASKYNCPFVSGREMSIKIDLRKKIETVSMLRVVYHGLV